MHDFDEADRLLQLPSAKKLCLNSDAPANSQRQHGLTKMTAAIFIVGSMVGAGVLALPKAVTQTGWIGIVLTVACCLMSGYSGTHLGKCWVMLLERYPEYNEHVRDPYPAIGYRAFGKKGSVAVSVCIDFTLFGSAIVYLLIASDNVQQLVRHLHADISLCFWLLILGAVLLPFNWLGTPKDFWQLAVFALVTTSLACVLIFIAIILDAKVHPVVKHRETTIEDFAMAFGTILFAFGGACIFPTVQHDMKEPAKFSESVFIAFTALLSLYLPMAIAGYMVYGSDITSNIMKSITPGPLQYIVLTLITLHLLFAFVIISNPVYQDFERMLSIPLHFNWKRCVVRTVIICLVLLVAETLPHFGSILSLIGGSTVTLLTFVLPNLFYLKLSSMESGNWKPEYVPLYKKVISIECIVIGIVGGIASTYSGIKSMASPDTFIPPCYVNLNITST